MKIYLHFPWGITFTYQGFMRQSFQATRGPVTPSTNTVGAYSALFAQVIGQVLLHGDFPGLLRHILLTASPGKTLFIHHISKNLI